MRTDEKLHPLSSRWSSVDQVCHTVKSSTLIRIRGSPTQKLRLGVQLKLRLCGQTMAVLEERDTCFGLQKSDKVLHGASQMQSQQCKTWTKAIQNNFMWQKKNPQDIADRTYSLRQSCNQCTSSCARQKHLVEVCALINVKLTLLEKASAMLETWISIWQFTRSLKLCTTQRGLFVELLMGLQCWVGACGACLVAYRRQGRARP